MCILHLSRFLNGGKLFQIIVLGLRINMYVKKTGRENLARSTCAIRISNFYELLSYSRYKECAKIHIAYILFNCIFVSNCILNLSCCCELCVCNYTRFDEDVAVLFVLSALGVLNSTVRVNDKSIRSTCYLDFSNLIFVIISLDLKTIPVKLITLVTNYASTFLETLNIVVRSLKLAGLILCVEIELYVSPALSLMDWEPVFIEPSSDPPK